MCATNQESLSEIMVTKYDEMSQSDQYRAQQVSLKTCQFW